MHAGKLRVRVLDLLHLCYVAVLKETHGINMFITVDEEMITKSNVIKETLKIND